MTNNNQVNWDEVPEDVEAIVTFLNDEPTYYKKVAGVMYSQCWKHTGYTKSGYADLEDVKASGKSRFHLRPSPATQPTPATPESTQVESSEVEATTTPEFDWSSVKGDVEAVIVIPLGHLMAVLKECDGVLLIGSGRGIHRMYPTRRANKVDDYPVWQLQSGDGILIRRPPATTTLEGKSNLDVSSIQTETYTPKPPSISTILQEAQQSILKHHGVTGKIKFTVTCSE